MAEWPGVQSVRLVRDGAPERNGLGAIRRVKLLGLTLDEEVVRWDPPHRFDYVIIKGLPVRHLGKLELTEEGDETTLTWRITLASRVPLLAALVLWRLRAGLPAALAVAATRMKSHS